MKTTLTLILLCGFTVSGFCQTKAKPANTVKVKPSVSSPGSANAHATPSAKPAAKTKSKDECKMDNRKQEYTHTFYECPKCGYDTTRNGICPKDHSKLKWKMTRDTDPAYHNVHG
jgi:hypothetical protein